VLSHQAAREVKEFGRDNNLVDLIRNTAYFEPVLSQLDELLNPAKFIGRAPEQVCNLTILLDFIYL
jgi:adenylosuccinate lyase